MTFELVEAPAPKSLSEIVSELKKTTQCTCDLDNWEPERNTGHSWVCGIHKRAIQQFYHPTQAKP